MTERGVALINSPRHESMWADRETPATVERLKARGIPAEIAGWYEERDWSAYALLVVRSPAPYWTPGEFVRWLHDAGAVTTILNAPHIIEWCLDKHYLRELAEAGVPVVPTLFVEPGAALPEAPSNEIVVKPVISAGSTDTARHNAGETDAVTAHVAAIHARGMAAMIQPYLSRIDTIGERALIYIDGVYDHAIRKGAVLRAGEAHDALKVSHPNPVPYEPTDAERALADSALRVAPAGETLYARVDIVDDDEGKPCIMELELIDPVMFHELSDGSYERFADAIAAHWRAATT